MAERQRDRALDFRWRVPDSLLAVTGAPDEADRRYDRCRRSILAAACIAADENPHDPETWWISFSRRREWYQHSARYQGLPYTYERVIRAVKEGVEMGLLVEQRASSNERLRGDKARQSRLRATPALLAAFQDAPFEYERRPAKIILRDDDKRLIALPGSRDVHRLQAEMAALGPYFASIRLTLGQGDGWEHAKRTVRARSERTGNWASIAPAPCIDPVRIFSRSSVSKGGRLYDWYHALPSARRAECRINGELIIEPDFASLHPTLLHAIAGVDMRHRPYEVDGYPRHHAKRALNVLINAASPHEAAASLHHRPDWPDDRAYAWGCLKAVERRNPAIKTFLGSDMGVTLMGIDSRMAMDVVKACAKGGIPVLPVHDSFMTPERNGGRVEQIMASVLDKTVRALKASDRYKNG